jgi:hypothetical protein
MMITTPRRATSLRVILFSIFMLLLLQGGDRGAFWCDDEEVFCVISFVSKDIEAKV